MSVINTSSALPRAKANTLRVKPQPFLFQPFDLHARAATPRLDHSGRLKPFLYNGIPQSMRADIARNMHPTGFPFPRRVSSDGRLQWRDLQVVTLENDRWRVRILPQLGGRVASIYDKSLATELLWCPPAIRQEVFGLGGAWHIGGIEFNAFRLGHNLHGQMTLRTEEVTLADGSLAVRLSAMDELFESSWQVTISLQPTHVAFDIRMENHSDRPQPGYWWTNIATPAHERVQLMYPPGPVLHHSMFRMGFLTDQWPMLHGCDWSQWLNHHEIMSAYFHQLSSGWMGYADSSRGIAMAHWADPTVCQGRKLWSIGTGHDKQSFWQRFAETAISSYYEIQSGRCKTQIQADLLAPGQVVQWTECVGAMPWNESATNDYSSAYAAFQSGAERQIGTAQEADGACTPRLLLAASARAAASESVVLQPETITRAEALRLAEEGWLGGSAWVRALESLDRTEPLNDWGTLALAAAKLDLGEPSARQMLEKLAGQSGPAAGWAAYLLGICARADQRPSDAASWLQKAALGLDGQIEVLIACHEALLATGNLEASNQLWRTATLAMSQSERGCMARAQVAFLNRRWEEARKLLQGPFFSLGEGTTNAWLLRKEVDLAEAFELYQAGKSMQAQQVLLGACVDMPQFGTGRDELNGSTDAMFYRWWMATEAGADSVAESLAAVVAQKQPYPGTVDAAYAWRLALLAGGRNAGEVGQRIEQWNIEAHDDLDRIMPLRAAVLRGVNGDGSGWVTLKSDLLYRYRAAFESSKCL